MFWVRRRSPKRYRGPSRLQNPFFIVCMICSSSLFHMFNVMHVSVVMCYNNNKSRRVLLFCIICCPPNLSFWTSPSVLFPNICLNQPHLAMYQLCQAAHTGSNQTRQRVARLAKTRNFSELFYELCINKELLTWVWFI